MERARETFSSSRKEAIAFDALSAFDRIFIRTRNSAYQFVVTDAARRRGMISGGLFGRRAREAVLVGALRQESSGCGGDPSGLRIQSQALFCVQGKLGVERFVTSTIKELAHLRPDNTTKRAA